MGGFRGGLRDTGSAAAAVVQVAGVSIGPLRSASAASTMRTLGCAAPRRIMV